MGKNTTMIRRIGLLRLMLYVAGLLVIIFLPEPGMQTDVEWPAILTTVVVPALAPIIFMVILFDLVVSKVVNRGNDNPMPAAKFFWVGLAIALIILLRWLPYLLSLTY